ncbi:hypothetical protein ACHOLT_00770 [Desulfitobacterium sp. Sab5]|uniref:hypothetical protein n=1 Tax=Desulfitobacterium nosdiversum TaxID=3375356 RepID=UPI003CF5FC9C
MNKIMRKSFLVGVLSLSLVMSLASISLATESNMNGMNMGGHSDTPNTSTQSAPHEAAPGMDQNMSGMNMGGQATTPPSTPHEATKGMDPNMPGMENNNQSKDEHGETGESEGVNWPVVGSFLGTDVLILIVAGVMKFIRKSKLEILG